MPVSLVISVPSIIMLPDVGFINPITCFSKTDLPSPDRPIIIVMRPSGISRSTPLVTQWPSNSFFKSTILILVLGGVSLFMVTLFTYVQVAWLRSSC